MDRLLMQDLLKWKNKAHRKPLLLKGPRQCGKTHLLRAFAEAYFSDAAYFNFEHQRPLVERFEEDLDVERLITELGIFRKKPITKETLIILDEIQFCPRALTSLKYFAEYLPDQPIACAGSLLGIFLAQEGFSFPVGKVEFLSLYPLSFKEFLLAHQEKDLLDYLEKLSPNEKVSSLFEARLKNYVKTYHITGGMPEAVDHWLHHQDLEGLELILHHILDSYEFDFSKHARLHDFPKITLLWKSIPEQLARENKKFIYGDVKKGFRAKDLESSLQWLIDAGLAYKVIKIAKPGIPLSAYGDSTYFKLYLLDVGLLRIMSGLPASAILEENPKNFTEFKGALAENFVLNEMIASFGVKAYYWKSQNSAEVDFVVQFEDQIVPIEVKSDQNAKARSLGEYRKKFQAPVAMIISGENVHGTEVKHVPWYLTWKLKDYLCR